NGLPIAINQSGTGNLEIENGTTLNNSSQYNFLADSSVVDGPYHGTFINTGTITKETTTGSTSFTTNFDNSGAIDVQSGTLSIASAGGVNTGGNFTVAAGATLNLADSVYGYYSGTYTGSGAGTVEMTSAGGGAVEFVAPTTLDFSGSLFHWTAG